MHHDEIRRAMRINPDPALLIPIGLIPLLRAVDVRHIDLARKRQTRAKRKDYVRTYRALVWNPRELHEFLQEMMDDE